MKKENIKCDCEEIHADVVKRVNKIIPKDAELQKVSNLYKVFADYTRVKILGALLCEKMCVCDLAVLLNMTKSAISHQLKTLRNANLVHNDKQGKVVYYSLADSHVKNIFEQGFEHIKH